MMLTLEPTILLGNHVKLEPINISHKEELLHAAQNEQIWTYNSSKAYGERFHRWFDKALRCFETKEHFPFVVRDLKSKQILGSTRLYDIKVEHQRATIGYTWYIPEVWGSFVNPECKFLLLQFGFETLNFNRIELDTDARNLRSRAAIKKLGAKEEGVLRQHMITEDGFVRDTVVFSIIKNDWAEVKAGLQARLMIFS